MARSDRRIVIVFVGLSVILVGIALWGLFNVQDGSQMQSMLLYLVTTPVEETQVWQLVWETRHTQRVGQLPGLVIEYASMPQTARIVYPVERADGGHDLWLLDVDRQRARRWLDCAPDDCRAVAPSPDGRGVVYTRVADGNPKLWWIGCRTTETTPLFPDTPSHGDYAVWSPDGTRLAYASPEREVCVVNFSSPSDPRCFPARIESPPVWSPDGTTLLAVNMQFGPDFFISHILRVDLASGALMNLSRDVKSYVSDVEDDAPAWSSDGQWIAFRRKAAGTAMGKQVWIMRADGSDAHALTTDTASYYGPPVWSEDGAVLLTTRYAAEKAEVIRPSEIRAISPVSATSTLILPDGYLPHWLSK